MQPVDQPAAGGTSSCPVRGADDETDTLAPRMDGSCRGNEVFPRGQAMSGRSHLQGRLEVPGQQCLCGSCVTSGKGMRETGGGSEMSKCRYCGSSAYGSCPKSPNGVHEHIDDDRHCEFCGSSAYGGCPKSPFKRHRHGHGNDKCVWCGSKATGGCPKSPSRRHER